MDISSKKKQLLGALTGTKLLPQIDERIRKSIKEIREFMTREQLSLVLRMKEIKDPQSISMLLQFLSLLQTKDSGGGSGLLGLPQFLSFLNKSQEDGMPSSARSSVPPSPRTSSTLPRPSNRRKSSIGNCEIS